LRTDVVAAEIAVDPEEPTFLIAKTEKNARNNQDFLQTYCFAWAYVGYVVLTGFVAYGLSESGEPNAALAILGGSAVFVAIWSAGVAVATANLLVDLRRRVDQAKANVDVELKRRSDLIPPLASAAKCLARYEREWQAMLATLRKQRKIVRVDGAEAFVPSALAARLFAVREKYPELRSNQAFAYLQRQMADAEDRVALAREYYNNIVENYETRRQTVPYCYFASFLKLSRAKFFAAEGFDAKTVDVDLET
jgi:LemA protein